MDAQQLVNALSLAAIYALFASGYTLQFGVLHILNYAYGPMYMLGAVGAYLLLDAGAGLVLAILIPVMVVPLVGIIVERIAIRPLRRRGAGTLAIFVATIGAGIAITLAVQIAMGPQFRQLDSSYLPSQSLHLGGVRISAVQVGIMLACVVVYGGFYALLRYSRQGRAMRGVAENANYAERLGVSTDFVFTFVFAITTAAAALAGVGAALLLGQVQANMANSLTLIGFSIIVLGGLGSVGGAAVAAVVLAFMETLAETYVSSFFRLIVPFVLLYLVLILRPQGLFGRAYREV